MPWRIAEWDEHYEDARTRRTLKHMRWVRVSTDFASPGYTDLVDHVDGAAHLGAWRSLQALAAKHNPRGVIPYDIDTIARVTRLSAKVFQVVIPRLLTIGWLEECNADGSNLDQSGPKRSKAVQVGPKRSLKEGKEWNGMERKRTPPTPPEGWSAEMKNAWGDWVRHRKEKKRSLTPTTTKRQITKLEAMGYDRGIAAIEHSISNGYTGLFEPSSRDSGGLQSAKERRDKARAGCYREPERPLPILNAGRGDRETRKGSKRS